MNQCDGCRAGIPLINGGHRMGEEGGYSNPMRCTKHLYEGGSMTTIKSIQEASFGMAGDRWGICYDGFVITMTDDTTIKFGISNESQCCESWGYLMSQDDFVDFIGATVISVAGVDEALAHVSVKDVYCGGIMFININTSEGLLQFVAYNEHNGYYSHEGVVIENGVKTISESL